jgi:hypothetical protein
VRYEARRPWRPSEFSPGLLVAAALSRRRRPLGISRSSRGHPARYRSYWFCGPTSPLAIPSAVWFSHTGVRRTVQHSRRRLSEFGLPPEYCPAQASPPAAAGGLLSWAFAPFSTCKERRSTYRGHTRPLRSACRVWLPSWRLAPSEPGPGLFRPGGARGIHPSELSPPERYRTRFRDW